MARSFALGLAVALLALFAPYGVVFAQSTPEPAGAAASSALPQDKHGGLTVSVDPCGDAHRAKETFGKSADPVPAGILPVDVYFKNETPHPIHVGLESVQLDVHFAAGKHQDLDWLTIGQVAYMIRHPGGSPSAPSARRFPVGLPLPSKDKKVDSIIADLRPFVLDSDVVPPLGSIHGFLFFDVSHDFNTVQKSSLYVPDVTLLPDKTPLMFFEVPLAKGNTASID
jgi:hypothetical protein